MTDANLQLATKEKAVTTCKAKVRELVVPDRPPQMLILLDEKLKAEKTAAKDAAAQAKKKAKAEGKQKKAELQQCRAAAKKM